MFQQVDCTYYAYMLFSTLVLAAVVTPSVSRAPVVWCVLSCGLSVPCLSVSVFVVVCVWAGAGRRRLILLCVWDTYGGRGRGPSPTLTGRCI